MKKNIRRVLAVAVCLIMVIGTMTPYAFAETPEYTLDGKNTFTSTDPDATLPTNIPEGTEWQGPVIGTEAGVLNCGMEGQIIWGEWEPIDAEEYVENDKHYTKETTYVDKYYYKWAAPLGSGLKAGDECIPEKHGVTIESKSFTYKEPIYKGIIIVGWETKTITYYYWRVNGGSWFENLENFLLEKRTEPVDRYYKQKSETHQHTGNCYTEAKTTYTWTLVEKKTPPQPDPELGSLKITKIIKGVESIDELSSYDIAFNIFDKTGTKLLGEKEVTLTDFIDKGNKTYTATSVVHDMKVGTYKIKEKYSGGKYGYKETLDEELKEVTISTSTENPEEVTFENEYEVRKGTILVTKTFSGISELPGNFRIVLERMTEGDEDDVQKPITLTKDTATTEKAGNSTTLTWEVKTPLKDREAYYRVYEENADVQGYNLAATYVVTIPKDVVSPLAMLAEGPENDADSPYGVGTEIKGPVRVYSEFGNEAYETKIAFNNTYTKTGGSYEPRFHTLTLNKQVVGLDNVPAGYEVTVNITNKATGAVKTVKLGANGTQTVFLPYGEYTLTEVSAAVDGYKQVGQIFSANDFKLDGSKSITVTNTYEKDAEEPIVDPEKPDKPTKPEQSNDKNDNPNGVPKTGDNLPLSLAIYGMIAAGALLGIRKATKRAAK